MTLHVLSDACDLIHLLDLDEQTVEDVHFELDAVNVRDALDAFCGRSSRDAVNIRDAHDEDVKVALARCYARVAMRTPTRG